MAYAQLHSTHAHSATSYVPSLASRLWQAYRGWRARRQMLRMLYSLDCATLKDIGVSPHEIESLVYGHNGDRVRPFDENWWRRD